MPQDSHGPTPYPEVNAVLRELLRRLRGVLGNRLVGLYLYGSLAMGDFDPARSDIDFVVVTHGELGAEVTDELREMHEQMWSTGPAGAKKLEGVYLPQATLRARCPEDPQVPVPTVNEEHFFLARQEADWTFQRYVLREHETIVAGPSLREFVEPVTPRELRVAVARFLDQWWAPMLQNPARLQSPGYQPYAVLSMCRALYTLEHGRLATKPEAAGWAASTLDYHWHVLIDQGRGWRPGDPSGDVPATLEFIK